MEAALERPRWAQIIAEAAANKQPYVLLAECDYWHAFREMLRLARRSLAEQYMTPNAGLLGGMGIVEQYVEEPVRLLAQIYCAARLPFRFGDVMVYGAWDAERLLGRLGENKHTLTATTPFNPPAQPPAQQPAQQLQQDKLRQFLYSRIQQSTGRARDAYRDVLRYIERHGGHNNAAE